MIFRNNCSENGWKIDEYTHNGNGEINQVEKGSSLMYKTKINALLERAEGFTDRASKS